MQKENSVNYVSFSLIPGELYKINHSCNTAEFSFHDSAESWSIGYPTYNDIVLLLKFRPSNTNISFNHPLAVYSIEFLYKTALMSYYFYYNEKQFLSRDFTRISL